MDSVLLPCQYSGVIPEDNPIVIWTRNDLHPNITHLRREQGDDHKDQDRHFRGRTSMNPKALDTGEYHLTLRTPHLSDSGNYTCSISDGKRDWKVANVRLEVKDNLAEVIVNEGVESVILPCKTTADLPEDVTVEWTRSDADIKIAHVSLCKSKNQEENYVYSSHVKMNKDLMRTGDVSLTLKFPTDRDSGSYICTVYRGKDILRQRVVLEYVRREGFPTWAKALVACLSVLVLVLVILGGLYFRYVDYFRRDYQVEVVSGEESVLLTCKAILTFYQDVRVEWTDRFGKTVHVYQRGSDRSKEQDKDYKGRTEMNGDLLKTGDLSLTLKFPSDRDRNTFTCTVYNRKGKNLMEKRVMLNVKVIQVEVNSGSESVQLPCRTTADLPGDAKVEWNDKNNWKVHVFQHGYDQQDQQHWFYKDRTEMKRDPLKDKDLSLTLRHPTETDTYTCTVYNREEEMLLRKDILLHVKVPELEMDSGVESVLLPFQTKEKLPGDIRVEWRDSKDRKVHVHHRGSDQPKEQYWSYRNRTEMKRNLLETGDLSLTLRYPTEKDTFICTIYNRDGNVLTKKQLDLRVKDWQVEVEQGAESVLLPFPTSSQLPGDSKVMWQQIEPQYRIVFVHQDGSARPEEQDQFYRTRTQMDENLLTTGDLSLTLRNPTDGDAGRYKCGAYSKQGNILRGRTVVLRVKGTVQDQPEDIRTTDPTPLLADQSV